MRTHFSTDHPAWILVTFVNILAVVGQTAGVTLITPECVLDDDGTNPLIERCLRKGDRFVEKYLRHVRTNKRWQYFDTCTEFLEFADCIAPMMEKCSSVQKTHHHWKVIYDAMKCVCNGTTNCQQDLQCFEQQYSGVLSRRCDAMYRFNVRQRTRDRCFFISENVRCKESLIGSACGATAGELAFHLFKLSSRKHVRKRICIIPHQPEMKYNGFRYSAKCPDEFPLRMEECRTTYLSQTEVGFHDENDLVAVGKRREIKRACRSFKAYKRCTRPIRDTCKKGANLIYDYDGRLRTYVLKMDYICNEVKQDYLHHVSCYREVLRNESLSQCDGTWKVLQPLLNSITAQQFYCQTYTNATRHLQRILDQLRVCYEKVFTDGCGHDGGDVLNGLMRRAFRDPYYLRFKYMPDCRLHRLHHHHDPAAGDQPYRTTTTLEPAPNLVRLADASVGARPSASPAASSSSSSTVASSAICAGTRWLSLLGAAILRRFISR